MKISTKKSVIEFSRRGITFGKISTPAPQTNDAPNMQATAGRGFEVTQSSRTRKVLAYTRGPMAQADLHMDKRSTQTLIEIGRAHDRQSSLISGMLDTAQNNIVGSNFEFNPNTGDKDLNKQVKEYIEKRMLKENCDATGVRDFEEMLEATLRAMWTDGGNLWTKRTDGSVLLFEADQLETPPGNPNVVLGVELNDAHRHMAYHVKQRGIAQSSRPPQKTTRVPAAHAFMPAYRKRINQTVGIPFIAAVLGYHDRFNNYLDFETLAADGNSRLGYQITRKPTENQLGGVKDNDFDESNDTFKKLTEMEAFQIFDIEPGEEIKMIGADRPGSNFDPYVVMSARIIGVGVGFPLELMMLDFSRTNFSSARASMGEARRGFKKWQKRLQTGAALPWYKWQIARGIASGELPVNPKIFKVFCQWPGWQYIDPKKSAEANAIDVAGGRKSDSECIRERGKNPDEVYAEIASDIAKKTKLGIPMTMTKTTPAGGTDKDEDGDAADAKEKQDQESTNG